ncbi:MAG: hypothetical protein R2715_24140 [Ilumatobacteraceae bacterium]
MNTTMAIAAEPATSRLTRRSLSPRILVTSTNEIILVQPRATRPYSRAMTA